MTIKSYIWVMCSQGGVNCQLSRSCYVVSPPQSRENHFPGQLLQFLWGSARLDLRDIIQMVLWQGLTLMCILMPFKTLSIISVVIWCWYQPAQAMPGTSPMLAIGPALAEAAAAGMARVNTWLLKIVIVQRCHHPISGDLYLLVAFQLLEYQWSEGKFDTLG